MWSDAFNQVTEPRPRPVPGVRAGITVVAGAFVLATTAAGCGGAGAPSGAEAPARPGAVVGTPVPAGTGQVPSSGSASPTQTIGSDGRTAEAAAQVVAAYFREINEASVAGRVADVGATALSGCQRCAHDVGNTRLVEARGWHADVGPYAVSDLAGGEVAGVAGTVEFTATLVAVRLLDQAGRENERTAAGPSRHGTAELSFTANGWRIRSLDYAPG